MKPNWLSGDILSPMSRFRDRMVFLLRNFRRIATRYDRNAANFLAAVCLATAVSYG